MGFGASGDSATGGAISASNSSTSPLTGGATYTGTWEDVSEFASTTVIGVTDVNGTLYADYSTDGTNVDRAIQLSTGTDSSLGIHGLIPIARYFRVRVVNGSSPQSYLRLQTIHHIGSRVALPTSRLAQTIGTYGDVLNTRTLNDPDLDTARGLFGGRSAVSIYGSNDSVAGSSSEIVASGGIYWLPTAASTLRIKAGGNADDTAAGTGARSVTIEGLNSSFAAISETLTTNGASASAATSASFIRVTRAYVSASGTYAALSTGANVGNITIEVGGGGTDVMLIEAQHGQSESAIYTVPASKTAYLTDVYINVDSTKTIDLTAYQRQNADDVTVPYTARRLFLHFHAVSGDVHRKFHSYLAFPAKTDIFFEAVNNSGTAVSLAARFDLILQDD